MNFYQRYGILGGIYIALCTIRTKFIFPKAKIIRFPLDLRGRRFMRVGSGFVTGKNCRIEVHDSKSLNIIKLYIGKNVQLNDNCHITAGDNVVIKDDVLIASKVYISDMVHGKYTGDEQSHVEVAPSIRKLITRPVLIEEKVWLGDGVCVLPGVTIGRGAIVGANAVVTKSIPPNSIAVGIPARVVKTFDFEKKKWIREKK
ncbi:MAG TPA: acetyltransferase [Bacteroidetes bacterium]|nr:acetyltransferase [Bacteroidota bacterium]